MDIVVGKIQSPKDEGSHKKSFFKGVKKVHPKERRKNNDDRRQNVRDDVIVSISFKDDRRILPDRRKTDS